MNIWSEVFELDGSVLGSGRAKVARLLALGRNGNIVLLDADPLEDIKNKQTVW